MRTRSARAAILTGAGIAYALLLFPTIVIIGASFNPQQSTVFPPHGFSLQWYGDAISQFGAAFTLSVVLGIAAALMAIPLAIPAGVAIVRHEFPGRDSLQAFLLSPILVPSLLIGAGLLSAFLTIGIQGTFLGLLLTHVVMTLPYVVRTIVASLQGIPMVLEECAATLGASPRQVMRHVTLPLVTSGIFAGALFAFLVSFGEINATVFVAGPSTTTLPIQIFSFLTFDSGPVVAAISVLQIALTLVIVAVIERTVGLGKALQFG